MSDHIDLQLSFTYKFSIRNIGANELATLSIVCNILKFDT
jgi:hypothetical protein